MVSIYILSYLSSFDIMAAIWFISRSFNSYCKLDMLWKHVGKLTLNQTQMHKFRQLVPSVAARSIRFVLPAQMRNENFYQLFEEFLRVLPSHVTTLEFDKPFTTGRDYEPCDIDYCHLQHVRTLRLFGNVTLYFDFIPPIDGLPCLQHLQLALDFPNEAAQTRIVDELLCGFDYTHAFYQLRVLILHGEVTTHIPSDWQSASRTNRLWFPVLEHFVLTQDGRNCAVSANVLTSFWLMAIGDNLISLSVRLGESPKSHGIKEYDVEERRWPKLTRIIFAGFNCEELFFMWQHFLGQFIHLVLQDCEDEDSFQSTLEPKLLSVFIPRSELFFTPNPPPSGRWCILTEKWILLVPRQISCNNSDTLIKNSSWKIRYLAEPFDHGFFNECWEDGTWVHLFHRQIEDDQLGPGFEKDVQFCDLDSILQV